MGESVSGPNGWIDGFNHPACAVQVQVSMWSVWHLRDQISAELGSGTGFGCLVRVMLSSDADRGWGPQGEEGEGATDSWFRPLWVSLEVVSVGVTGWEHSGVGRKAVEREGCVIVYGYGG